LNITVDFADGVHAIDRGCSHYTRFVITSLYPWKNSGSQSKTSLSQQLTRSVRPRYSQYSWDDLLISHEMMKSFDFFYAGVAVLAWLGRQGPRAVEALVVIGSSFPWIVRFLKSKQPKQSLFFYVSIFL
jgi:hypothetical protein